MQCQKADQSLYHYNGVSKSLIYICLRNAGMVYVWNERLKICS